MRRTLLLALVAVALCGCYPERGRAYLACNDKYPRPETGGAAVAGGVLFGAVGGALVGAAAGAQTDANKEARNQCLADAGVPLW